MGTHLRATGRHLPYGITQCYLPPDTSELPPPSVVLLDIVLSLCKLKQRKEVVFLYLSVCLSVCP